MNPSIDWIRPIPDSLFLFDDFIDVTGNFTMLNNETSKDYTYGWRVIKIEGDIDISSDVVKPYY
jgi:hypothetical protein